MAAPSHNPMQQRAIWHDYRSRCIYMITLQKAPVAPALSIVKETPNGSVVAEPTEAGLAVRRFVCFMDYFHPALQTWKYVIMPDHIHLLLFVKEELPLRWRIISPIWSARQMLCGVRLFWTSLFTTV